MKICIFTFTRLLKNLSIAICLGLTCPTNLGFSNILDAIDVNFLHPRTRGWCWCLNDSYIINRKRTDIYISICSYIYILKLFSMCWYGTDNKHNRSGRFFSNIACLNNFPSVYAVTNSQDRKYYCFPEETISWDALRDTSLIRIWITQSCEMVFILNLDNISLKKLFPTMNI